MDLGNEGREGFNMTFASSPGENRGRSLMGKYKTQKAHIKADETIALLPRSRRTHHTKDTTIMADGKN